MNTAARIRELHALGWLNVEIAEDVGRSGEYVRAVLSKHRRREMSGQKSLHPPIGRPKRVDTGEQAMTLTARILALHDAGRTTPEIVAELGCSDSRVRSALNKNGRRSYLTPGRHRLLHDGTGAGKVASADEVVAVGQPLGATEAGYSGARPKPNRRPKG